MIRPISNLQFPETREITRRTSRLPGNRLIGIRHYHAIDPNRNGKQTKGPRQFMLSAFYPAKIEGEADHARLIDLFEPAVSDALAYLTEALDQDSKDWLMNELPLIGLQAVRGGATDPAALQCPVLIHYPAGGSNRFGNVDVCEGLASYGFVVLAIDGPHDAPLVVFPDGFLCKGPLEGDYITPGVADVGSLIDGLAEINRDLNGMMDVTRIGTFGHSRGGYISNIAAFKYDPVLAVASIDSFLWGYATKGTGLERHSQEFQAKVHSTPKSILRLCGRPVETAPQEEAEYCLRRDGADFVGDFTVIAFPGWQHSDFRTTPWLCGKDQDLVANQSREKAGAAETLTEILTAFFNASLRGGEATNLDNYIRSRPGLGFARKR